MCDLEEKEGCGPAASFVPTLDAPFSATQRASTGVKSSCVVEQRPKWRRDESQRCRLLACVACVVIALCLIPTVSVTIFYKLSRDSANGTQQDTLMYVCVCVCAWVQVGHTPIHIHN